MADRSGWNGLAPFGLLCLLVGGGTRPGAASETPGGVVVEEVARESAAEKAGLQPGDVLLSWSRSPAPPANPLAAQGQIESAFDLAEVEIEQAPRGSITLAGRRGQAATGWTLRRLPFGLTVRPQLPSRLLALYEDGRELVQSKRVVEGVRQWRLAATEAKPLQPAELASWLLYRAAKAMGSARGWSEADALYEEASAGKDGDLGPAAMAQLLREWGGTLDRRGDWKRAESCYRRALGSDEQPNPESLALALTVSSLGVTAARHGDLAAAEDHHRRALAIRERQAPGSFDVANSLSNLGIVARGRGDFGSARAYQQRALEIREKLAPGGIDVAASLNNLGTIALLQADLPQAEAYLLPALAIRERLAPGSLETAGSLGNLSIVAKKRGDLIAAEEYSRRALAIQESQAPGGHEVSLSLNNLGSILDARGDLGGAEDLYRRSLAMKEKLSPEGLDVSITLNNLGLVAQARGDLAGADAHLRRSLLIKEKLAPESHDVAAALHNLGLNAWMRGDAAAAEDHQRRALAIEERVAGEGDLIPAIHRVLGHVARSRGDLAAAEDSYQRALAIYKRLSPGSADEANALHDLGVTFLQAGRSDAAIEHLLLALDALESQRAKLGGTEEGRAGFVSTYAAFYHDCIAALIAAGRHAEAVGVLERSRARSFLALLAERDLLFSADLPFELALERRRTDAEYDRVQASIARGSEKAEIDDLLGQLRELRERQEAIATKIRKASPRFASLQYPQPADLAAVRDALDPGTVLLSYSVGTDETFLFVVRPAATAGSGLSVSTLAAAEKALRQKVEAFRTAIQRPRGAGRAALSAQAAELYDLLVRPAESEIAASERLLVSPDGPLHSLPFGALVRRDPRRPESASSYLVEWKPLHVVTSATVYAEIKKARRREASSPDALVAFGDPHYPPLPKGQADPLASSEVRSLVNRGFSLTRLPSTRKEVEAIADLFPARAQTFLGEEATEERAKALGRDARYVHFACHGYLDERFPLNSALALTIPETPAAGQDNGLLQAWEIFERVRIDADLVTLSACETGLGKEMGGEGLLGLSRAFHYAGARSVLASLWAVSDRSTALLMKRFYGYLKAGKTRDTALRAAQIDLIRPSPAKGSVDLSEPFHWAAFQLSGDWE